MFIKNKYKFRGGKENEGIINKRDQDKQEHKERREERGERREERGEWREERAGVNSSTTTQYV